MWLCTGRVGERCSLEGETSTGNEARGKDSLIACLELYIRIDLCCFSTVLTGVSR